MTCQLSPNHHWVALVAARATGTNDVSLRLALAPTVRVPRLNGRGRARTDRTPENCLTEHLIPTSREVAAV